jgi:hypothetical protein
MKILVIFLLTTVADLTANKIGSFVHPGIWFKQDDLNRMISKVEASQDPWKSTSIELVSSASKTRDSGASVNQTNAYALQDGGSNILKLAMAWVVTGDVSYGNSARDKINEWSVYQTGGDCLRQGIGAGSLVNAAEIIRFASVNGTTVHWPPDEIAKFENMLIMYMMPTLETLKTGGDGGWGTPAINAMASIGVFCDNTSIWDKAISIFKSGSKSVYPDATACNGVLEMIDPKGESYDSGRDQPHAQFLISHLFDVAIIAWNQGTEDLFSYGDNRLLLGMEYGAKYNLGNDVPYTQEYDCHGQKKWGKYAAAQTILVLKTKFVIPFILGTTISPINRFNFYTMYEKCVAYYESIKGIPAPYSKQVINKDGYYPEKSMTDCFGYGGLVYRR